MGLRYQKRISLGKFLRLNISKTGVGASLGVTGLRLSTGPSGTQFTLGLPGTGLSYTKRLGTGKGFRWFNLFSGSDKPNSSGKEPPALPSPGFFARREEKELAKGLAAYQAGNVDEALEHFLVAAPNEAGAAIMAANILAQQSTSGKRRAIPLLEAVIHSDAEFPTSLMQKYLANAEMEVAITPTVTASIPVEGLAAVLLLAELYQVQGRIDEAIALLEEVEEIAGAPILTLSLCELYFEQALWEGIIDRASQLESEDDITLATMIFYGRALLDKGLPDGAISALTKAVRRKKDRSPELLNEGLYWRAMAYQTAGKASRARQEFEKLYAADPNFRDVAQRVGG